MAERFLSAWQNPARTLLFPRKQRVSPDRPGSVQGAKRRKRALDGEGRSGIMRREGEGDTDTGK